MSKDVDVLFYRENGTIQKLNFLTKAPTPHINQKFSLFGKPSHDGTTDCNLVFEPQGELLHSSIYDLVNKKMLKRSENQY